MVTTRRGALLKPPASPPPINVKAPRPKPPARQLSSSKLIVKDSTPAIPRRRGRPKKHTSSKDAAGPSDAPQPVVEVPLKPSLFGFKYDQAAATSPPPPFNPTICYEFVSSCPPPNPEPQNDHVEPSTSQTQQASEASSAKVPDKKTEFELIKEAIIALTQYLTSRFCDEPDPEVSRVLMENLMSQPGWRSRVPLDLLAEYDAAIAMEDDEGIELIDHLVKSTSRATQIAKEMVSNQKRYQSRQAAQNQQSEELESDPAFDAVMRAALTSCNLALNDASFNQSTADGPGPSNSHHPHRAPFHPAGATIEDDMAGFEVESVAPTINSARVAGPSHQAFRHPGPLNPTPATAPVTAAAPGLFNPREALMQSSGLDLDRILDPTSRESRCVRKARALLAAIRMTAGDEEAEEVYTGMHLMIFYDMVGVFSTEIYSTTYRQGLHKAASAASPPSVAGPSQAALRLPRASAQTAGAIPQNAALGCPPQTRLPNGLASHTGLGSSSQPIGFQGLWETGLNTPPDLAYMGRPQAPAAPRRSSKHVHPTMNAGYLPGMSKAAHLPGPSYPPPSGIPQPPMGQRFSDPPQASTSAFIYPSGLFHPS